MFFKISDNTNNFYQLNYDQKHFTVYITFFFFQKFSITDNLATFKRKCISKIEANIYPSQMEYWSIKHEKLETF